jgi:hypothetical protein
MPKQKGGQEAEKVRTGGKPGVLPSPHRDQPRRVLPELSGGLLNSLAFVGGLDLAKPNGFLSSAVDLPRNGLR